VSAEEVAAFVERTRKASGVPATLEDVGTISDVVALLQSEHRTESP
jgi:hypothetical protein